MFERNKEKNYSYDIMLLKVFSPSPTVTLYYALYLLSLNYVSICSWRRKPSWINLWKLCLFLRKMKKHQLMLNAPLLVGGRKHQKETGIRCDAGSQSQTAGELNCKNRWQHYFDSERMICSVSDGKHAFCSVFLYYIIYIILYYIILLYCINVFLCPSFSLGWFRKSSYLQY